LTDGREASAEVAATLTLLALRSAAASDVDRFVFPPSQVEVSEREALTLFRHSAKPLRCRATPADDKLVVFCHTLVGNERRQREEWLSLVADSDTVAFIRRRATPATSPVLVRAGARDLIVSLEDLTLWRQEYAVENCSLIVPDADREAQALGVAAILHVSCIKEMGSLVVSFTRVPRLLAGFLVRLWRLFYRVT
jgi:hypothetical protein